MLSEADLQELRGMAFDRLLLRVWPKDKILRLTACCSCGRSTPNRDGRIIQGRGLCNKCYSKWKRDKSIPGREHFAAAVNVGPVRHSGTKLYDDLLLAKRAGVSLSTLRAWRNGQQIPHLKTLHRIAATFESEFGVPVEMWMEAAALSQHIRGWTFSEGSREFTHQHRYVETLSRRRQDSVGRQYGYWLVVGEPRASGRYLCVTAECLVCRSIYEVRLQGLMYGQSSACMSCANRLRSHWSERSKSGLRGVGYQEPRLPAHRCWMVGIRPLGIPYRMFADKFDAARYYDACMYERYGHTLFLNFPNEYDRSNDPVFAVRQEATA